jgi:hypothetical protein
MSPAGMYFLEQLMEIYREKVAVTTEENERNRSNFFERLAGARSLSGV